ncbi:MAG: hypothetical protein ACTHLW_06300 [Verrucomicrobiota bacterium]
MHTEKETCPLIVTVVVVYVAVQLAIALLNELSLAHWSDLQFQIKFTVILLLGITLPFCLWRGQRWARWAVLAMLLIGFASTVLGLVQRRTDYSLLDVAIQLLHSLPSFVLVLCLFHPVSSGWFREGHKRTKIALADEGAPISVVERAR